jgi:hypothetical protein
MTTQNSSYSRILAVWLVLFAFLCGMVVPSVTLAKVDMVIATEGDPTDGLGAAGGGGDGLGGDGDGQSVGPASEAMVLVSIEIHWKNGKPTPVFFISEEFPPIEIKSGDYRFSRIQLGAK